MYTRNQESEAKMRAVVRQQYGGPEELVIQERAIPQPKPGDVVIQVKAFGVNHAETYMRKGEWGDVAKVSGIECAGLVETDPESRFARGQKVVALMGGMGRTIDGSYAEYTCGVHLSFFGSFMFGTAAFPLSDVPLQTIIDRVAAGAYKAKPARVFRFEEIREAHRVMESNQANGKLVVQL